MFSFCVLRALCAELNTVPRPESEFIPIPRRPSTAELAEDLMVDPEALKMETHEPGIFDESGDYVPMYSDDPKDLEHISANPLDAPEPGDTAPESVPAEGDNSPVETPPEE